MPYWHFRPCRLPLILRRLAIARVDLRRLGNALDLTISMHTKQKNRHPFLE